MCEHVTATCCNSIKVQHVDDNFPLAAQLPAGHLGHCQAKDAWQRGTASCRGGGLCSPPPRQTQSLYQERAATMRGLDATATRLPLPHEAAGTNGLLFAAAAAAQEAAAAIKAANRKRQHWLNRQQANSRLVPFCRMCVP